MDKKFSVNGGEVEVKNYRKTADTVSFELNGKSFSFSLLAKDGTDLILQSDRRIKANIGRPNRDGETLVMARGRECLVSIAGKKVNKVRGGVGNLTSPMPGKIFKIVKEVGSIVSKGETILILEAMKMEHSIRADKDGKVKKIMFRTGDLVQGGVTLAEVE